MLNRIKMVKVLFVCLGNICRSPMAEGLFKKHVEEKGLSEMIHIDSAGTSNYHIGKQPDSRMCKTALKRGITLDHKGRQLGVSDLDEYDYILAMDQYNFRDIRSLDKDSQIKASVIMMRDYDSEKSQIDVPDPYYGGEEGFTEVYDILDRCTRNFLKFLCEKHRL